MYISIGDRCNVKFQIDKHRHQIETLFFDRIFSSMHSVMELLRCDNIDDILYFDNVGRDKNDPTTSTNSRIVIKSLDYCTSVHDLPLEYSDNDIVEFIDKYKRRFNRIIEYIKSNEKIYFIRSGPVDDNDRQKFIKTILKINPNCNFALVVIDNNINHNSETLKYDHCLYIKLNINRLPSSDWTTSDLEWEKIFLNIENNI